MRISSNNITELKENEIFVFGSNLSGRHGRGAAKTAMKWGAVYGQAEGLQGNTYAIPTVNYTIKAPLKLEAVKLYINNFISYAKHTPDKNFLVTAIGCGLAGYTINNIAPLFREALHVNNIYLPQSFIDILYDIK